MVFVINLTQFFTISSLKKKTRMTSKAMFGTNTKFFVHSVDFIKKNSSGMKMDMSRLCNIVNMMFVASRRRNIFKIKNN